MLLPVLLYVVEAIRAEVLLNGLNPSNCSDLLPEDTRV